MNSLRSFAAFAFFAVKNIFTQSAQRLKRKETQR